MYKPTATPKHRSIKPIFWIGGGLLTLAVMATPLLLQSPGVDSNEETAGAVNITTDVVPCDITFIVHPEKRIPPSGNWSEDLNIQVVDLLLNVTVFNQTVTSDNSGHAKVQVCPVGVLTDGSHYDVLVKGGSHLRKRFSAVLFQGSPTITIDLTGPGKDLLAGDTDLPVGNNTVNYNDVTQLSINLYSNNRRNDLNRDGKVNSLDLSNMVTNLGKTGQ
jgi:hypothetical protein